MNGPADAGGTAADALDAWRVPLAVEWAAAINATCYVPMSPKKLERRLRALAGQLADALVEALTSTDIAAEVGRGLIDIDGVGERALRDSLLLLRTALLGLAVARGVDDPDEHVAALLAELATSFAIALQQRTFEQQEALKSALVRAREAAERNLRESESRFAEVFASAAVGMAITDLDGRIVRTNDALTEILGYTAEQLTGQLLSGFFHGEDVENLLQEYDMLAHLPVKRFRKQCRLIRNDTEPAWTYLAVSLLTDLDDTPTHFVTSVEDITDLYLIKERFKHQTMFDSLTGLANRAYFTSHLQGVVERPSLSNRVQLYYFDLDGLTAINTGLDRRVGDRVLQLFADKLSAVFAHLDAMVARLEGTKFAVLAQYQEQTPDVVTLVEAVREEVAEPIYVGGHGVLVTVNIAVVDRATGESGADELLVAADLTLRQVKRGGKSQWGLFDDARYEADRARYERAAAFPEAWESGEVAIRCRAVAGPAGVVAGVLLEVAWDSPEYGLVPHGECVRLAEEVGIDLPLGEWLLRGAAEQAADWRRRFGDVSPFVLVGLLGGHATDQDLVALLRKVLDDSGLAPGDLGIALPASCLRDGIDGGDDFVAGDNAEVLLDLGVPTWLSGFGDGHRDLALLERYPVRGVLLGDWVTERLAVSHDPFVGPALAGLLALTADRGVRIVAGGAAPAERLHGLGVDLVHADLPTDPDDLAEVVEAQRPPGAPGATTGT
ncbi:diguanylate cyclase [Solihabitans fulvus]|uniref:Diguanylate cyclase n=1 Tax=Solihabitans fulvus TaxID=1892852 RepID=A0A5B2X5U7_9PSEU|nr:diguanylate cyclase [Solihabitans fulvus]KAA2258727.1 diguanylate cyclase [Solihabitans fulvus]